MDREHAQNLADLLPEVTRHCRLSPGRLVFGATLAEVMPVLEAWVEDRANRLMQVPVAAELQRARMELVGLMRKHLVEINEKRAVFRARYYESDTGRTDFEELINMLDAFAPDDHYFGQRPSDAAMYGYWPMCETCTEGT